MTLPSTIPFVWPTALHLTAEEAQTAAAVRKWIQVAKTGEFFSTKYGKFAITPDDLRTMLSNFQTITPIAPTQLPVDYDHLSMSPKNPGDGKAAGWFTGPMELRDNGDTLWAEVEFTPPAVAHVKNGEYKFVSPSFVKNYIWKNGQNIGTTLIAAAITNHPFLEGMSAITLSNDLGELAVSLDASGGGMEVGQVVAIKADVAPALAGQPLEIVEVAGAGADAFAKLKAPEGAVVGWFRISDLEPAPVVDPHPAPSAPSPAAHLSEAPMSEEVFTLRDARGTTSTVKPEELQAFLDAQIAQAKAAVVPEGSVVISASKLTEFETTTQQVTSLRNEVTSLREANDRAAAEAHLATVTKQLDKLSAGGKITKPERDHLLKTYSDPVSLAAFEEYYPILAARPAMVNLGAMHGSSVGAEAPDETAEQQLTALAKARAQERNIPFAQALKQISAERLDLSQQYRQEHIAASGRQTH